LVRYRIYFFQDAPIRAKQWAIEQHPNEPAVICSLIQLENCIDLFDVKWFPLLKNVYNLFEEQYRLSDRPLPKQNLYRSKVHRLDSAFFNYANQFVAHQGQISSSTRAVFVEGDCIFPNSAIFDLAHVQISVTDPVVIK
jgi:hypothetical protein